MLVSATTMTSRMDERPACREEQGKPMTDTAYYDKPVLLDRDKHRKRRVKPTASVAMRLPCRSATRLIGESQGTASTQRTGAIPCLA